MKPAQHDDRSSNNKRVDVLIIGGGPATLGLLCNALKTNRLHELCVTGDGIAIVEQGLAFGGGQLQNYGINSNTSANGFIKHLYKKKEIVSTNSPSPKKGSPSKLENANSSPSKKVSKVEDKQEDESGSSQSDSEEEDEVGMHNQQCELDEEDEPEEPTKKYEFIPMNPFKELYQNSNIVKVMREFGSNIVPLQVVGLALNYTGNHLLSFIHQIYKKKIFYPMHKVISIQLLTNGEIVTTCIKKECIVKKNKANGHTVFSEKENTVVFRSKGIVFGQGAHQPLHPDFYKWFPGITDKEKVILSDQFLRHEKYREIMTRIKEKQFKNIVIVGGSHSGFSCAWMLLNGPAQYNKNASVQLKQSTAPYAQLKSIQDCTYCCTCPEQKKKKDPSSCACVCKCYGYFQIKDWDFDYDVDISESLQEEGSIKILYRDRIRVFYGTVRQAEQDGYKEYNPTVFSRPGGFLYSFTGLRGNAKALYKRIKKGEEKRIELIKAPTIEDQRKYIEDADLIIWACGYQSNPIKVKDNDGKLINLQAKQQYTQNDVDNKCRLITQDKGVLTKVFGTGVAFPMRTNDGMIIPEAGKPNPRSDSFTLYLNYVGDTILKNLLPKNRLDSKLHKLIKRQKNQPNVLSSNNQSNQQNNNSSQQSPVKKVNNTPSRYMNPVVKQGRAGEGTCAESAQQKNNSGAQGCGGGVNPNTNQNATANVQQQQAHVAKLAQPNPIKTQQQQQLQSAQRSTSAKNVKNHQQTKQSPSKTSSGQPSYASPTKSNAQKQITQPVTTTQQQPVLCHQSTKENCNSATSEQQSTQNYSAQTTATTDQSKQLSNSKDVTATPKQSSSISNCNHKKALSSFSTDITNKTTSQKDHIVNTNNSSENTANINQQQQIQSTQASKNNQTRLNLKLIETGKTQSSNNCVGSSAAAGPSHNYVKKLNRSLSRAKVGQNSSNNQQSQQYNTSNTTNKLSQKQANVNRSYSQQRKLNKGASNQRTSAHANSKSTALNNDESQSNQPNLTQTPQKAVQQPTDMQKNTASLLNNAKEQSAVPLGCQTVVKKKQSSLVLKQSSVTLFNKQGQQRPSSKLQNNMTEQLQNNNYQNDINDQNSTDIGAQQQQQSNNMNTTKTSSLSQQIQYQKVKGEGQKVEDMEQIGFKINNQSLNLKNGVMILDSQSGANPSYYNTSTSNTAGAKMSMASAYNNNQLSATIQNSSIKLVKSSQNSQMHMSQNQSGNVQSTPQKMKGILGSNGTPGLHFMSPSPRSSGQYHLVGDNQTKTSSFKIQQTSTNFSTNGGAVMQNVPTQQAYQLQSQINNTQVPAGKSPLPVKVFNLPFQNTLGPQSNQGLSVQGQSYQGIFNHSQNFTVGMMHQQNHMVLMAQAQQTGHSPAQIGEKSNSVNAVANVLGTPQKSISGGQQQAAGGQNKMIKMSLLSPNQKVYQGSNIVKQLMQKSNPQFKYSNQPTQNYY